MSLSMVEDDLLFDLSGVLKEMEQNIYHMISYDKTVSEIENINSVVDFFHNSRVLVHVYTNDQGDVIYLKNPENLTVSDYQGFKFSHELELFYNEKTKKYKIPFSFHEIDMFDDLYHGTKILPTGTYKIKIKRREIFKRNPRSKVQKCCGYQYCFEAHNIKRSETRGFSGYGAWDVVIAYRVVMDSGENSYYIDNKQIYPSDL